MGFYWLSAVFYGITAWGFLSYPASIGSNDAWYFASSIEQFSVSNFAPHFPGYPVFVAMVKGLHQLIPNHSRALITTTTMVALLLPLLMAWLLKSWGEARALLAFWLGLSQPLLPVLALSGLSDGTGLLFLLLAVGWLMPAHPGPMKPFLAGLAWALALWARPSYGVILLALVWPLYHATVGERVRFMLGVALISLPALGSLLAVEGWFYFVEAWRFTHGHIWVWGNTPVGQHSSWLAELVNHWPLLLALIAIYIMAAWVNCHSLPKTLLLVFGIALLWTALMQNPHNLRHLAPILGLGSLVLLYNPHRGLILGALALQLLLLSNSLHLHGQAAPLSQAAQWLNQQPGHALFTRHGVSYLRSQLPDWYIYDGLYGEHPPNAAWQLRNRPLPQQKPLAIFHGRFMGEGSYWLYGE